MLARRLKSKLEECAKQFRIRKRLTIDKRSDNRLRVSDVDCINFCSNDYLGLTSHPDIKTAVINAVQQYGFGSGSSSLISGYFKVQEELERKFAEFVNCDQAILFNSGYCANLGIISTFANRNTIVAADKLCHASLLDGIQLSKAKHYRYQHNNVAQLKLIADNQKPTLIITEAVFSMEGDITPLKAIADIAHASRAALIVDDAHGIGVLGAGGRGSCEFHKLTQNDVSCLVAPLGKAFGCLGAMVAGKADMIEAVLQFARPYRYTTALPPANCAAALSALELIQTQPWRREVLGERIEFFIECARQHGFTLASADRTPIKSIIVGDNDKTHAIQTALLEKGFLIGCIRPPTVPEGTARLRISLNCLHDEAEITCLLNEVRSLL